MNVRQGLMTGIATLLFLVIIQQNTNGQTENRQSMGAGTNGFFDNDTVFELTMTEIQVEGEISHPGNADLSALPLYPVIVKETLPDETGAASFTGAYKYEGYALSDILDQFILNKSNAGEFPPLTDLYVEIFNDLGQRVVISWGEIYYPNKFYNILIAKRVMRIVPEKTGERWPLPTDCKIIIAHDLLTVRNIANPTRIVVRSCVTDIPILKGKYPLTSNSIRIVNEGKTADTLFNLPQACEWLTLPGIFYGKGRGLHSTEPFTGCNISPVLAGYFSVSAKNLSNGLVLFCADDGYRAVFTMSELCNRNDHQNTLLLLNREDQGAGRFRLFPSCDFFSDRAVRGLSDILFSTHPM